MRNVLYSLITLLAALLLLAAGLLPEQGSAYVSAPPASQREANAPALPASACQSRIEAALAQNPLPGLTYWEESDEIARYGYWRLEGVTGALQQRQVDHRQGPVFDLVQVHTRDRGSLWAAAGVTLAPYYFVRDEDSLAQYRRLGHGDAPYYVSFINGLDTAEAVREALQTPGAYRVSLTLNGPYVSQEGLEWEKCLPVGSDFCQAGAFVDRLLQENNQTLVETGSGSMHWLYGFATFSIALLERVDLCPNLD